MIFSARTIAVLQVASRLLGDEPSPPYRSKLSRPGRQRRQAAADATRKANEETARETGIESDCTLNSLDIDSAMCTKRGPSSWPSSGGTKSHKESGLDDDRADSQSKRRSCNLSNTNPTTDKVEQERKDKDEDKDKGSIYIRDRNADIGENHVGDHSSLEGISMLCCAGRNDAIDAESTIISEDTSPTDTLERLCIEFEAQYAQLRISNPTNTSTSGKTRTAKGSPTDASLPSMRDMFDPQRAPYLHATYSVGRVQC